MKILLTGASGFLGSALALYLKERGHHVFLLLRAQSSLQRLKGREEEFDCGRYRTDDELVTFVQENEPEVIIHTACSYGRQGESTLQIYDANIRLGLLLLESIRNMGSSTTFINTGTILASDTSTYALSKNQFGQWARLLAEQSDGRLRFVDVLLQHMYGPDDDISKFTTHVLRTCQDNEPALKLTAGEQKRDFIYINDVVSAYEKILLKVTQLEHVVEIEVGTGVAPSIREFVEIVHELTASRTELQFGVIPYRINEPMHCQANIERICALGWSPSFDLRAGLKKTIEEEVIR